MGRNAVANMKSSDVNFIFSEMENIETIRDFFFFNLFHRNSVTDHGTVFQHYFTIISTFSFIKRKK